jgi:2-polyprenyl-3-methyl-5-hydroxy-6-metoxy-1,4-benzoquinol methylase
MQERHLNRQQYFDEQSFTTENFVIPYINDIIKVTDQLTVAEIGCGEGGNLKPFLDMGCKVVGIDMSEWKINHGIELYKNHPKKHNLSLIIKNIYDINNDPAYKYDLIIMRDTLEHIHDQETFVAHLKTFLKPGGKVFLSFPAWRMPFGGHQQMCQSKFLSLLPYFHILPVPLYKGILKLFGENQACLDNLLEVKSTEISTGRFNKIMAKENYKVHKLTYYLINPNYEIKFKLKTRVLPAFLNIPHFRDFFVTTIYTVISID